MAIEDKITHQVRAAKTNLDKLFDKAAADAHRRTDSLGRHAGGAIDRARNTLRDVFKR
ncbi:hypothetical protein [Nocardia terpenica]|uniref:hypothetical protein n=1 Tax=Nocardia terpenica TaxID=455432 RepID=UPI0002E58372|nr:hypothetical protein [Nocardia terpenica]NQE90889.1 hypothetical protein [Nocardia terpenica]